MPNDRTITNAWGRWRVRARDVEELTGYAFFEKVPEAVRKVLIEKAAGGVPAVTATPAWG